MFSKRLLTDLMWVAFVSQLLGSLLPARALDGRDLGRSEQETVISSSFFRGGEGGPEA